MYQYIENGDKDIFNFNGKYAKQWQVIFISADHYILQWPKSLPDKYHTVTRDNGWGNEPDVNASFVWADDNYMGLALLTRLVRMLNFCEHETNSNGCNGVNVTGNISTYIDFIYEQHMGFAVYLIYPESKYNGLYAHGYNYASGDHSCCPWGRANAWILTSRIEAIEMFQDLNGTKHENEL